MLQSPLSRATASASALFLLALTATAQVPCPEEPPLAVWTGGGSVTCPCFVAGEEAGAVLNIPAQHLPAEILRVGYGWGSAGGGNPDVLGDSINIYNAGLPNPGVPIFSLNGPVLSDGFINEYNLEAEPGTIIANSSTITVTLRFLTANAGQISEPSMVHDGNGCTSGANVVKAIPGGWNDACALGVSGDWIVQVVYRPVNCGGGNQTYCVSSANSAGSGAQIGFVGSTSIGANDLVLTCTSGPAGSPGLFYYGVNQTQVPFGDGFRCVGGSIYRLQPPGIFDVFGNVAKVVDNTIGPASSGASAFTPGSIWNFQYWYRDTAAGMSGFNVSNGLSLTFVP